jgi:MYXO-CTERM domain-containing protein
MKRLVKQSVAAAATLMLASAAHASLVTYEFTGSLTIGPMGDLAVPEAFSGHVSFHDGLRDRDTSDTHGQYVDHRRSAVFATRIGDQDFVVHGGRRGEIDVDFFDNDPSVGVGGGADGLGIFATNPFLSMGFFQLYDADVFHNDRLASFTPPLSGAGGFFIDEGAGGIFSGWFDSFTCTTCAPATSVAEPSTLPLAGAGLLMLGYATHRRRKVSQPSRNAAAPLPA